MQFKASLPVVRSRRTMPLRPVLRSAKDFLPGGLLAADISLVQLLPATRMCSRPAQQETGEEDRKQGTANCSLTSDL